MILTAITCQETTTLKIKFFNCSENNTALHIIKPISSPKNFSAKNEGEFIPYKIPGEE
jgi:hypothetical protein